MFGIVHYEVFLFSGILLNLTPGIDTIYVLSRSIARGRRAGIYSAFGITSGCAVHTLLAALGLSLLLAQSAAAFTLVKLAGAAYLAYLGITAWISKSDLLISPANTSLSNREMYWQGLLTNVLNPKVALFFLSFLPQFIDPANSYGILPFLLLGATFIVTGTIWSLTLAYFAAHFTQLLRENKKAALLMNKACGVLYIALGIKLLTVEQQ